MVVRDIYSLLEQYLADGFTFESMSKVSNVSVDIIERCYRKEKLTEEEILKSSKVLDVLGQLYMCETDSEIYLKDVVEALEMYFVLSHKAIASYMGLSVAEFNRFLDKPSEYPDGFELSVKLLHLRNVLLQRRVNDAT